MPATGFSARNIPGPSEAYLHVHRTLGGPSPKWSPYDLTKFNHLKNMRDMEEAWGISHKEAKFGQLIARLVEACKERKGNLADAYSSINSIGTAMSHSGYLKTTGMRFLARLVPPNWKDFPTGPGLMHIDDAARLLGIPPSELENPRFVVMHENIIGIPHYVLWALVARGSLAPGFLSGDEPLEERHFAYPDELAKRLTAKSEEDGPEEEDEELAQLRGIAKSYPLLAGVESIPSQKRALAASTLLELGNQLGKATQRLAGNARDKEEAARILREVVRFRPEHVALLQDPAKLSRFHGLVNEIYEALMATPELKASSKRGKFE